MNTTTQSPATHTPTPWSIAYYSPTKEMCDQSAFIIMPEFGTMNDGKAICSGHGPDHKANAAFIVRACNSHAQLVAACAAAFAHLESVRGRDNNPEVWTILRAALSAAQKGTQ